MQAVAIPDRQCFAPGISWPAIMTKKTRQPVDSAADDGAMKAPTLSVHTTRWLRDHRGRLLSPARLAAPMGIYLSAMAAVLCAVGADLDDARWLHFAARLEAFARELRALT